MISMKKLLFTDKRSTNQLCKVRMGLKNTMYLYVSTENESSKWHAGLEHIYFDSIESMIQKKLVLGIPKVNMRRKYVVLVCLENKLG